MSEKLCVQWIDFKENAKSSFGNLREGNDFTDVTLACEDGKQIEAHKVILASSSPFFQNILKRNKHPHPLIYMKGVRSDDLSSVVDFLYCGEANVFQANLETFLALAEELQLQGLMGKANDGELKREPFKMPLLEKAGEAKVFEDMFNFKMPVKKKGNQMIKKEAHISKSSGPFQKEFNGEILDKTGALKRFFSGDVQELDEKCISLMEKTLKKNANGQLLYTCRLCGKEAKSDHMKDHIEVNHLEGVSIPCNLCDKELRSRDSLRRHRNKYHPNIMK